ncbi:serine/threonine-protein kinase [Brevibacillus laterosporus]|uniref:serine/threonine-protein kinase n=1 Tax=Brevibacillus laterosporus TaxID=1465 RepID=UPI000E6BB29B|nr:serine/threonine-protein kinase [Brevibacillus laterosporus]AYB40260.1 serine/threonine protein kinase [Brevibacillus laterosporus]MBM7107729.1 Serine/threonine-protein kinase StkP [Brevibacillus laterosporus]
MIVEIINVKGSGYFCDVKKARDASGRIVAVKQLKSVFVTNSDYVYRFKREIELLERLNGVQHIVPCLDKELDDVNLVYRYMMPFATFNLYNYIRNNNNKISLEERIHIYDQVLEGMRYAHSEKILHRDIAPNNVLLFMNKDGIEVKISDFGLGKDYKSLSNFTKSVGMYGQQLYVAPEQYEQLNNATEQSDIYSLGKLLYFVITGRDPLTIQSGVKFQGIIQKAVRDNPKERFESIEELSSTIE